jgi:hypothetical protein
LASILLPGTFCEVQPEEEKQRALVRR